MIKEQLSRSSGSLLFSELCQTGAEIVEQLWQSDTWHALHILNCPEQWADPVDTPHAALVAWAPCFGLTHKLEFFLKRRLQVRLMSCFCCGRNRSRLFEIVNFGC